MRRLWLLVVLACCVRGKPAVPILAYHSVGGAASEYVVPVASFEQQLDWLASRGFRTVSLHDAEGTVLVTKRLPRHRRKDLRRSWTAWPTKFTTCAGDTARCRSL